ncbi:MAG: TRAP-type histidine uptake transport system small permease component [Saliniramus fredricksonii]|uniref:TRAP transporter small permease protein n=1 Tax=Saliniramus fredricksonii TaxID=1653334 RepID=A0A0P7XA82_9HYPH|nr:TRAP transporter small permease subunit [Saliniramus fredricksonii]KPQ12153.1 MAG: TRAP-type histidine uptake transport system small permease component [Saliniramus fredricksonii]SCC78774.1 TRAP-type mannitol/chloroaromatic compound transport system, small permease component [Saliniramus fredricksonii]
MARIADALDWINRIVGNVVMWFALAMVLLQFALVILRYVFGIASIFAGEGVLYLHAGLFMLGAGYTLLLQGHVRVDIFYARRSRRGQAIIDIFGHLALLGPALVILLYWSWPMVRRSWAILEGPISVGGIPASFLLKSLIPAFCVLLLIQGVSALIRDLIRLREAPDAA